MTFTVFHSLILTFPPNLTSHHSHPPTCLQSPRPCSSSSTRLPVWRMQYGYQGLVHTVSLLICPILSKSFSKASVKWHFFCSAFLSSPSLPFPVSSLHSFFPLVSLQFISQPGFTVVSCTCDCLSLYASLLWKYSMSYSTLYPPRLD